MIPRSPLFESYLLKVVEVKNCKCKIITLAIAKRNDDWEKVNSPPVEFDNLQNVLSVLNATYDVTFLTKKEAFLEIL